LVLVILVGVGKTTHTRLDAEHVVGDGIHEELGTGTGFFVHLVEGQGHVVETREVGGAGGLMSLGVQGEGVRVDVLGRDPGEVLVRLDQTEVRGVAFGETVVTVELQLASLEGVAGGSGKRGVVTVGDHLGGSPFQRVVARGADHPHESLHGVVEVQAEVGRTSGLGTGVLKLLDEVLVGRLGETATLVGVEVDVVDEQAGVGDFKGRFGRALDGQIQDTAGTELDVDLDLVVLQGDEGQGQAGVTAEEELQRDVQLLRLQGGAFAGVAATDHLLETGALLLGEGELGPNVEPLTVVLVNALAANLELDVLDEGVTEGVDHLGFLVDSHLEPHVGDQITVTADGAGHAVAEGGVTVEGLLDGLHGEVGVAAVDHLKEADFGLAGQEDVLGAVGYELHKSSSHGCLCVCLIILKRRKKMPRFSTYPHVSEM
jgi:hypothetical protein